MRAPLAVIKNRCFGSSEPACGELYLPLRLVIEKTPLEQMPAATPKRERLDDIARFEMAQAGNRGLTDVNLAVKKFTRFVENDIPAVSSKMNLRL